jgi:hypothetical protein
MGKSNIDRDVAVLAYHDSLESVARLASFATAKFRAEIGIFGLITRARELAQRDIVMLALSVRRLSEICGMLDKLEDFNVTIVEPESRNEIYGFYPTGKSVTLRSALGKIIHHKEFQVFNDDAGVKRLFGLFKDDVFGYYNALTSAKDISAVCYVKSDRGDPITFSISSFVRQTSEFLQHTESHLADHEVYVGGYATQ